MNTEFRKAVVPDEIRRLCAFDRKRFPSDYFSPSDWQDYETYWLLPDGRELAAVRSKSRVTRCISTPPESLPHIGEWVSVRS